MSRFVPLLFVLACSPRLYTDGQTLDEPWSMPENTWGGEGPPEDLVGEGLAEGQIALDIRGFDQHGDDVSMWQWYGQYVLVDISTMWCAPCRELARGTEYVNQKFQDDGVVYLTVLHENEDNQPVSQEELEAWSQWPQFAEDPEHVYDAITAPIISDPKGVSGSIRAIQRNQYPVALLIGPDMTVVERIEPVTEGAIVASIEAALAGE